MKHCTRHQCTSLYEPKLGTQIKDQDQFIFLLKLGFFFRKILGVPALKESQYVRETKSVFRCEKVLMYTRKESCKSTCSSRERYTKSDNMPQSMSVRAENYMLENEKSLGVWS